MKWHVKLVAAGLILPAAPMWPQNVKLAKIALGMTETEVKTALVSSAPFYINRPSGSPDLYYLVAETEMESHAFTLIDGRVAAFSVTHILPPGQLPFLPAGQQPTASVLRSLITRQTWAPAESSQGDTWWFSDASGAPLSGASQCAPQSGEAWLPFGTVPGPKPGGPPLQSAEGLLKPSFATYPSNCGVSIHLRLTPGERRLGGQHGSIPGARHQGDPCVCREAPATLDSRSNHQVP